MACLAPRSRDRLRIGQLDATIDRRLSKELKLPSNLAGSGTEGDRHRLMFDGIGNVPRAEVGPPERIEIAGVAGLHLGKLLADFDRFLAELDRLPDSRQTCCRPARHIDCKSRARSNSASERACSLSADSSAVRPFVHFAAETRRRPFQFSPSSSPSTRRRHRASDTWRSARRRLCSRHRRPLSNAPSLSSKCPARGKQAKK